MLTAASAGFAIKLMLDDVSMKKPPTPRPKVLPDEAERHRLLAEMAEQSTDMISRHRPGNWEFIYASPAVTPLLGYSVDEIIGMSAYELYHPDDVENFKRRAPSVRYERGMYTHTYRFRRKDGSYTWLESTSRSIRDAATGELKEILVVSRDASQRINAELQMQKINQASRLIAMGELASGLAHELNQPLTAIVNYARGMERRLQQNPVLTRDEYQQPLAQITRTAQRASAIVRKTLDFSRRHDPQREPLVLPEVLRELIDFCTTVSGRKDVEIRARLPDDLPPVLADRIQVEQILLNLIMNAIEATASGNADEPKRLVTVTATEHDAQHLLISVSDQGSGIAADNQEQLFEQFFTTKPNGLGMGLAISRSLVEAHGGQIWAENAPTGGAVFRFTLNKTN